MRLPDREDIRMRMPTRFLKFLVYVAVPWTFLAIVVMRGPPVVEQPVVDPTFPIPLVLVA